MPQMHLLSKSDLLPKEEVDKIVRWSINKKALEDSIEAKLEGTKRLLSRKMVDAVYQLDLKFMLIPISSKTNVGLLSFNSALERLLSASDKYTY
jgi:hypothetical protein